MANNNIRIIKFFPDLISYHRGRGSAIGAVTATDASTNFVGLPSTKSVADLLDLRPLNQVTFDTSSDTDGHVLFTATFATAAYKQNYIAILNHNLATSVGKIRLFAGNEASDVTALNGANADTADINWDSITKTEAVNADTISVSGDDKSLVIEPATDGTTIITFTEQDLRYWGIQFEGNTTNTGNSPNGTWGSTDFALGGVMIGEAYSMPINADVDLKRSIAYDNVSIQESVGGQRYASATSFGRKASTGNKSPFSLGLDNIRIYGGRQKFDLNFTYMDKSDVLTSQSHAYVFTDDTVMSDVWNMTDGPTRPFIFCMNEDSVGSNAETDYLFARFAQNEYLLSQIYPDIYNVSLKIEEEF